MSVLSARNFVSWALIVLCPLSLVAGDTGAAVVHSQGGVWVNGAEAADSTAIFPGDALETKPGFVANLDIEGTSVLIQPESIIRLQKNFLSLEHGSVSVGTSTLMSVHVNCIKIEPISSERTQYDVADVNGTVQVDAHKNDVNITQGGAIRKTPSESDTSQSQSATVHEGQQATRDESTACGAAARPGAAGNAGDTKWLKIGGAAAGAVLLCILLCRSSGPSSVSPWQP